MTLKFLAAGVMAATLIGCADAIEVPDDNDPGTVTNNSLVFNLLDPSAAAELSIRITDSNGTAIKTIQNAAVNGTGANAIVYIVPDDDKLHNQGRIFVSDRRGENARSIYEVRGVGQEMYYLPTISANGQMVAFVTRDSVNPSVDHKVLHLVKADGTGHLELSNAVAYETIPALSPTGDRVAFFRSVPGGSSNEGSDLVVSRTDGTGSEVLISGINTSVDFSSTIDWSPDGTRILYATDDDEVHVLDVGSRNDAIIGIGGYPVWSSDGSMIAYTAPSQQQGYRGDIVVTSDMGITLTYLTNTAEAETHVRFSPDGRKVLCTIWQDDATESPGRLKLIDIATKEEKIVADPIFIGFWVR
jgi:Tol biopolymer transport system component